MNLLRIIRDVLPFGLVEYRRAYYRRKAFEQKKKGNSAPESCIRTFTDNGCISRNTTRPVLSNLGVVIVDHCNLSCRSCCACSPIAKPNFLCIEQFKSDMKRISELFWNIYCFSIAGGELLLHPDVEKFIKVARGALPITDLCVITNGILLGEQPESFWKTCAENKVVIKVSNYPIKLEHEKLLKLGRDYRAPLSITQTSATDPVL